MSSISEKVRRTLGGKDESLDPQASSGSVVMEMTTLRDTSGARASGVNPSSGRRSGAGSTTSTKSKADINDVEEGPEGGHHDNSLHGSNTTSNVGALGGVGLGKILLGVGSLVVIVIISCVVFRENIFGAGEAARDAAGAGAPPAQTLEPEETLGERAGEQATAATEGPNAEAAEAEAAAAEMVGKWRYRVYSKLREYTISRDSSGTLQFDEVHSSGRSVAGKLKQDGEFWKGELTYTDTKKSVGTIRLRLSSSPALVSNFMGPGEKKWNEDKPAFKVDPLPALEGFPKNQ